MQTPPRSSLSDYGGKVIVILGGAGALTVCAADYLAAQGDRVVYIGRRTKGGVRVNTLIPGFFLGEQNRRLLTNEDGSLTDRGQTIVAHTPFGRFGEAAELNGAIHFFVSEASRFVTGTMVVVDGGFGAFSVV